MTYRELMTREHPELVGTTYTGGVSGCPGEHFPEYSTDNYNNYCGIHEEECAACWNREIPGFTENINKEKIVMTDMTNKTKTQLFDEINQKEQEIWDLKKELEKLEKYKEYEKAGDEMYAIMKAFMNSGFSREEAFALITTSMQVFSR